MPCLQGVTNDYSVSLAPKSLDQRLVPVTAGHEVWQPRLSADAATKDPGLCTKALQHWVETAQPLMH